MKPSIEEVRARLPEMVKRVSQREGGVQLVATEHLGGFPKPPRYHGGLYTRVARSWWVKKGDGDALYIFSTSVTGNPGDEKKLGERRTVTGHLARHFLGDLEEEKAVHALIALERFEREGGYKLEFVTDPAGVIRMLSESERARRDKVE